MFSPTLVSILLVLGTAACQTSDPPHQSLAQAETEAGGDLEAAAPPPPPPPPPLEQEVSGHFKLHVSYQPLYQPSYTLPDQAGYNMGYTRTTWPDLLGYSGLGYSGQYVLSTEDSQAR